MFKKRLVQLLPLSWRVGIFKLKLIANHPLLLRYWNSTFAVSNNPILLVSLPRSGSSWLGEVLAQQHDVRYLREPITSIYMTGLAKGVSFFSPECCKSDITYQNAADNAFSATFNFPSSAVHNPRDWNNPNDKKRLLIKEVNPLYLGHFMCCYNPKVIYLERCIYATAKSFLALGWTGEDLFSERFEPKVLEKILSIKADLLEQDFYFQMGFLQGIILAINEPYFAQSNILRVNYENLIENPESEVKKITAFLNYNDPSRVLRYITQSLSCKGPYQVGSFSTQRNSEQLREKHAKEKQEPNYYKTLEAYHLAYTQFKY